MGSNVHSEPGCAPNCAIADGNSGGIDAVTDPNDKIEDQVCSESHVETHRSNGETSCGSQPRACAINYTTTQDISTKIHNHQPKQEQHHEHVTSSDVKVSDACCCVHGHSHVHENVHAAKIAGPNSEEPSGSNTTSANTSSSEAAEQVSVTVTGMSCSGCGNSLKKALQKTPGVSHVQVNFVAARAEFRLDTGTNSVDDVIHRAERATGFLCVRLQANGEQFLDLRVPSSALKSLRGRDIPGLLDVTRINKRTARLSYNPVIIGARALQERVGDFSHGLAPVQKDEAIRSGRRHLYYKLFKTVMATLFTAPVCALAFREDPVPEKTKILIEFVLATMVQAIAFHEFYIPAITTLIRNHTAEMDALVVISITAAYICSFVGFGLRMGGNPSEKLEMFEASSLLILLILLGRLIAAFTRMQAMKTVSLRSLQPASAIIVENNRDKEIDSRLLQFGDRLKIVPYTRAPTDGQVLSGHSELDESMLTGESLPILKDPGMNIIAGTMNGPGELEMQLTRLPGDNTVTDIAKLVAEASNSKPRVQDLADLVASYFIGAVLAIAVIVLAIWVPVELKVRHLSGGDAAASAITYAVAVLAISCPCALGLAVPLVLAITGMVAASEGVVIKSAESIERCRKVTDVVFDKTGTLTESDLEVVAYQTFSQDADEVLAITKALVKDSKHPISVAVTRHLNAKGVESKVVTNIDDIPGAGVKANLQHTTVKAGSPAWTLSDNHPCVEKAVGDGFTVLSITRGDILVAEFSLTAKLRSNAISIIETLHKRGVSVHLVSGDQKLAVETIASRVSIPPENVAAQMTPIQKGNYVSSLMAQKKVVLFCGDGTNDAIAVTQADIGVQLGGTPSSSDVTRGAADVILMAGLGGIPYLLNISRQAFYRIVFNFTWAAVYNVMAILLAAGAIVVWRVKPAYAGLGEAISVLPVCFAAMSMLWHKPRQVAAEGQGWRSRWPFRYVFGFGSEPIDSIC